MSYHQVFTLDLNFLGKSQAIAVYLIPHKCGAALIECGPGSTREMLVSRLAEYGYKPEAITDVFLTHIHLDHSGAAGWLASGGAQIHVHPLGAPHIQNPEKLLASAARIYGDKMDKLWGEFIPVPTHNISTPEDGQVININGLRIKALDTPGHANHHFSYLVEGVCFTGDIGGVRIPGTRHLRLPMPPPELNLENWRASLHRLQQEEIKYIAPTHFGIFADPEWQFKQIASNLEDVESWIEKHINGDKTFEQVKQEYIDWCCQNSLDQGLSQADADTFELANPTEMSSYGIYRYWHKSR
jgi:glyoxylase-like metal-dependent hydrolase (beta-lactamase superfamily II)